MSSPSPELRHQTPLKPISRLVNTALTAFPVLASEPGPDDHQRLEIPLQPFQRRVSLDSTYSELSEPSINSAQSRHGRPLLPPAENIQHLASHSLSPAPVHHRRGIRGYLTVFWLRNKGVVLVLLAMVFGSGMNVAARLMETDGSHGKAMHPFQILFARMSITVLLSLLYGFRTHIPYFPFGHPSVRRLLILRGVGGFFGVFGLYSSLLYLPLAEATVLTFLAPILTCYACSVFIKGEAFSRQQQAAGFASLAGVVFIARPGSLFGSSSQRPKEIGDGAGRLSSKSLSNFTSPALSLPHVSSTRTSVVTPYQHLQATLLALLGVIGATIALTTIRKIGTRTHPLISVNYFSSWCTLVSMVAVLAVPAVGFRLPGNAQEWGLLALLGVFGFIMQFLLTAGLAYGSLENKVVETIPIDDEEEIVAQAKKQSGDAELKAARGSGTRATSMLYTQMLFALAFDKWIWDISPEWQSWVGSVIILGSAVWVAAARDKITAREEEEGSGAGGMIGARIGEDNHGLRSSGNESRFGSQRVKEQQGLMHAGSEREEEEEESNGNP